MNLPFLLKKKMNTCVALQWNAITEEKLEQICYATFCIYYEKNAYKYLF